MKNPIHYWFEVIEDPIGLLVWFWVDKDLLKWLIVSSFFLLRFFLIEWSIGRCLIKLLFDFILEQICVVFDKSLEKLCYNSKETLSIAFTYWHTVWLNKKTSTILHISFFLLKNICETELLVWPAVWQARG
jgi:hypothetical protein